MWRNRLVEALSHRFLDNGEYPTVVYVSLDIWGEVGGIDLPFGYHGDFARGRLFKYQANGEEKSIKLRIHPICPHKKGIIAFKEEIDQLLEKWEGAMAAEMVAWNQRAGE
jgi:hypothetical protein